MTDLNDDIARYLSGQMSAAEMHALEKKALDDPFLADALTGGESILSDEFAADVAALQEQIGQRTIKRATVAPPAFVDAGKSSGRQATMWSWPVRIAAGLLLLACASVMFYYLQNDKRQNNLALNGSPQDLKQPESKVDNVLPQSSSVADSAVSAGNDVRRSAKTESATKTTDDVSKQGAGNSADLSRQAIPAPPAAATQSQPARAESAEEISDGEATPADAEAPLADAEATPAERAERRALAFEQSGADAAKSKKEAVNAGAARSTAPPAAAESKTPVADTKKRDNDPKNIFTGKVVDDDGNGIPGVNVLVKGTNTGTVTDVNGNYQLALSESKPTLVFTFIGYANAEEVADIAKPMSVKLDEDVTQLSEIVVAGYGTQRDVDPLESTYEFAYPSGGKRHYKRYLEKNLQYPQQALLNNVEGRVTVQFAVETTGSLVDFKVIKGIGNGCDEEVIRLIKSGPKWIPTKRDDVAEKSVIKVRMKFQLPKKTK